MNTMTTVHKTLFGAVVMSLACMFAFNASASDRDYRERDRGNYNPSVNHVDNNRNNNYDSNRSNRYEGNRNNYGSYGNNSNSSYFNGWFGNSNRFSFNGGYNGGYSCGSQRNWVEGYYESVCTKVLVCAAHTERRWVEPTYQTGYYGGQQRCVREGYWQDVYIPARYEDRCTRVWHPGCYRSY